MDWAVLSLSQGLLLSVVCGIFIGTDFSDGTLRNKIVAYASFYNMLTMLLKDKTTAVVAGMVITLVSMFLSFYLMMRTFEPEFITITSLTDSDIAEKVVPNKKYLSGCAVKIVQFIIDFLPSGQSIQISHMTAPNIQYMWLYSFMIIMITNITGISVFRKK